jgi:hypothetical protein
MPIDRTGNLYSGETKDGVRHGSGNYSYPHGGNEMFTYSGKYSKGVKSGGKFTIAGISTYEGEFDEAGEMTGKGRRTWTDGRTYEGDFVKGEQTGYGRWEMNTTDWLSGEKRYESYEGDFIDNVRHGKGVYSDGKVVLTGEFKNHKFNGPATVTGKGADGSSFTMTGGFHDNKILGQGEVTYATESGLVSRLSCAAWKEGQPTGSGTYLALNGEYAFKGSFCEGLPEEQQLASYLWASVDRAALQAQEEAEAEAAIIAAGGKPTGKKAPPKKGEEGPAELVVPLGRGLGALKTRAGGQALLAAQKAELEAAANDPKAAKGKGAAPALAEGEIPPPPEPPMEAPIPCELQRQFKVTLRRVLEPAPAAAAAAEEEEAAAAVAAPTTCYSDPLPFWLRNCSQDELACDPGRFSADSALYREGKLVGVPPASCEVSAELSLEGGAEAAEADALGSSVSCHRIPTAGGAVSFSLQAREVPGATQGLSVVSDFKIDPAAVAAGFKEQHAQAQAQAQADAKAEAETQQAKAQAEAEALAPQEEGGGDVEVQPDADAGADASPVPAAEPVVATIPTPTHVDVSVMSLSRELDGTEIDSSALCLYLRVPVDILLQEPPSPSPSPAPAPAEGEEDPTDATTEPVQWAGATMVLALRADGNTTDLQLWPLSSSFCPADWHSLALSLGSGALVGSSSSAASQVVLDGELLVAAATGSEGADGAALAWLPEQQQQEHEKDQSKAIDAGQKGKEEEEQKTEGESEGDATNTTIPPLPRMKVRIGGACFAGAVKAACLFSPVDAPYLRLCDSTACFRQFRELEAVWKQYKRADWYSRAVLLAQKEEETLQLARRKLEKELADVREMEATRLASATAEEQEGEGEAALAEQKIAELTAALAAPLAAEAREHTVDIPLDCKEEQECVLLMNRGVLETDFTRLLVPSDTGPGKYAICIEDMVPDALIMPDSESRKQRDAQTARAAARVALIEKRQAELDTAIAEAPAQEGEQEEGAPAPEEDATVVAARQALAEAELPLELVPRALTELGGMVKQVNRIPALYLPFTVVDPKDAPGE